MFLATVARLIDSFGEMTDFDPKAQISVEDITRTLLGFACG
jgi:hypothetical protein